jgi:hypothetical protein
MSELREEKDPIEVIKKCNANTTEELEAMELNNFAMEEAMMALELEEYNNLSDEEKELIDYINAVPSFSRSEYDNFIDQIEQRKEGYILDNLAIERSENERTKYLNDEFTKIVQEITKSDVGRDYLINESKQKLLDLFDTSKDDKYISSNKVVNLTGQRETFGKKRKKLIDNLIPYFAIIELRSNKLLIEEPKIIEKDNPHKGKRLQDILKYPELYKLIIDYLELNEIISKPRHIFIGRRNKTLMPGLLQILEDQALLNEKISLSLAESVLVNTFNFDLKRDTFGKRYMADIHHINAIKKLLSQYIAQNIKV